MIVSVRTAIKNHKGHLYIPNLMYYHKNKVRKHNKPINYDVLHSNFAKPNPNPLLVVPKTEESPKDVLLS